MADVVFQYGPFFRQYGIVLASATVNAPITVGIPTSTNANLYTGALGAGDVKVSLDGGAEANINTLPTQVGATGIWAFILSAAELVAAVTTIHVKKAGTTAEIVITVETTLAVGRLRVNSTGVGGNTDAATLTAIGTGLPLNLVPGTGRHTNIFDTSMVAEMSAPPPTVPTIQVGIQAVYQRMAFLVTQTVSTQTWYKADSVTPLTSIAVADDGTTQSKGKAA
jgi:hypothetical protein